MKRMIAMLAVLGFVGLAFADGDDLTSTLAKNETCTAKAGGCCMDSALAKLPKMSYRVGDQDTCCAASAKQLAEDHSEPIMYVVAAESYESEADAYNALADATEAFVAAFAEPKTCAVSGSTSLAGHPVSCSEKAKVMAKAMHDAMDEVQVAYKVGDETCHCPTQAKTLAEKSGEPQQYVIGDKSTCCAVDARIKLAQAKYKAAVEALAKLQAETSSDS